MARNTVGKRADMVKKRYGATTKGNSGGHKARKGKTTVRPGRVGKKLGLKIKRTF